MGKALTKEDLIYILQSVLKISEIEDNALNHQDDGLYVKDYHGDLEAHTKEDSIHVTSDIKSIISKLSVNDKDELMYNGHSVMNFISKAEKNMLTLNEDGFYVPTIEADVHIKNSDIHVTLDDKQKWDSIVSNVEQFVAQELMGFSNTLKFMQVVFVSSLPKETDNGLLMEKTLYFLADDPERPEECTYTTYIWQDGKWHTVGITKKTLKDYVTNDSLSETLKKYVHNNQAILDSFSEDEHGNLLYKGKSAIQYFVVSEDDDNAIEFRNGRLYVRDYTQEINSLILSSCFVKTNLYNMEINDVGTYTLKDSINNYTFLLIEYFHEKNDSIEIGGCVKTAILDTDTLREIYDEGKTYMIEYGYGALTAHIQFTMNEDKIHISYRRKVSIYKITGVRGTEITLDTPNEEEGESE